MFIHRVFFQYYDNNFDYRSFNVMSDTYLSLFRLGFTSEIWSVCALGWRLGIPRENKIVIYHSMSYFLCQTFMQI